MDAATLMTRLTARLRSGDIIPPSPGTGPEAHWRRAYPDFEEALTDEEVLRLCDNTFTVHEMEQSGEDGYWSLPDLKYDWSKEEGRNSAELD